MNIVIMGNGILGNLAALYFRRQFPADTAITIIGPEDREGLPVVGESIIEITTLFLENQLDMGDYLMKNHLPKYALTYYFKLEPDDPADRTYAVHCNERGPRDLRQLPGWDSPMAQPASWLINREVFDRDIRRMVDETPGIRRILGHVQDVDIQPGGPHTLQVLETEGSAYTLNADWVIDVTGRRQLLARKFNTIIKPEGQRDCFWFRVKDFDRDILKNIDAQGPMPPGPGEEYHYDRYYSTHHFMGKGNWIWMIPMKGEDGGTLMSVGFVSHPDHFEGEVRNMDDFLRQVDRTHPVVGELTRSGEIVDTQRLKRYHYVVTPMYSADRWAIVGDAAYAPDPLFSNGLAFGTIQLEQIAQMIRMDREEKLSPEFVGGMVDAFLGPVLATQTAISNWYGTMHDPYLSAIRLNWIEISYFYLLLPLVVNKCHYLPERMPLWRILQNSDELRPFEVSADLVAAREALGKAGPEHFVYMGKEKVNLRALEMLDDLRGIHEMGMEGARIRQEYTRRILARIRDMQEVG